MKNKKILLVTTAVLALCSCNNPTTSSSSSSSSSSGTQTSSNSNSSTSESSSSSVTTTTALQMFDKALKKDYSNLTLMSYQQYNDGEISELDYEYMDDNYVVDYAYSLREGGMDEEDCYSYYYIDNGTSYTYWEADSTIENSKGGWVNKGFQNADLSIWKAYFYLPKLLDNITIDDVAYQQGLYYIKDVAKVEELNLEAFGYAWFNDIIDICFMLDDSGYISKIYGFCDDGADPKNYVQISLTDFGTTTLPRMENIPSYSEATKTTYWQYKGWPQDYVDVYYSSIATTLTPDQGLTSDETHDVVLDLDKSFTVDLSLAPTTFEPWEILHEENKVVTWHYDETLLEKTASNVSNRSVFRAIGSGETEIYASVNAGEGKTLDSKPIKVKVNPAATQDKTGAVYDFVWASIGEDKKVVAQNQTDSKALFDITAGPGVSLVDGKNSDLFNAGTQYMLIDPLAQDVINNPTAPGLYFDFGEQQVSKISFNYGLFYANHKSNLGKLKSVVIRTSNDGVTYDEIDITEEVKENISTDFVKLIEKEFAPASKVEIVVKGTMIGNSLGIAIDSLCFIANDQCHNYVAPEDVVHVESVNVSPASVEMYVEDTATLIGTVQPQNATDKSLVWHVKEGQDCVSLENGKLTALKAGSAVVYATSVDGGITSNEVTVTVNEKPSFNSYLNNSYLQESGSWLVEILDATTAKISNETVSVTASITSFKNEIYTLTNEQGETFCLQFDNKRVDITNIKYLKDGTLKEEGGTKYCNLRVFMTDFTVKVGSETPNEEGKYDVIVGNDVYLSILSTRPSDANVTDVTYTTSNAAIATVEITENEAFAKVTFVDAGEVTITVTDSHNPALSKQIVFVVKDKTYPTDDNWTLTADTQEVEIGGKVNFKTTFDPSINTDTTVTYSVDNEELATITQRGVLSALAEGTVVVTASVNTKTGVSTKTMTITIKASAQGAVPAEIRGDWTGMDIASTSFTFSIDTTGATFTNDAYAEHRFVYAGIEGNNYVFELEGDSSVRVLFELGASGDMAFFTLEDPSYIVNDYSTFYYDDTITVNK